MMRTSFKIGFQVSTEAVHAVTGYCAAEMAIEEANASRNLPVAIELMPVLDMRDPAVAREAAAQFARRDDALAVLGPLNSALAVATQDIYHGAGMVQLTSEASSPLLVNKGYRNFFRLVANDHFQGRALAQVAVRYLHAERIAILHDASAWGRPIAEIVGEEARRLGCEPVLEFGFGDREHRLDFDALTAATLAAEPDLVYFAVYWNKAHIIAHRLRDLGLAATFLGSDALKPYAFLEVPSLDAVAPYHTLAGVDMRIKTAPQRLQEKRAPRS